MLLQQKLLCDFLIAAVTCSLHLSVALSAITCQVFVKLENATLNGNSHTYKVKVAPPESCRLQWKGFTLVWYVFADKLPSPRAASNQNNSRTDRVDGGLRQRDP